MPVEEFVERALYGPDGFYETGGRAGRRGATFVTSVEVGPLFGAVVANALDEWWRAAGEPDEWIVVDAGAGPGTLARSIVAAQPACADALRVVSVERTAAQRALHPTDLADVTSSAELPDAADVIIANELLDNLPFDLVERTADGWVPVVVDDGGATTPDDRRPPHPAGRRRRRVGRRRSPAPASRRPPRLPRLRRHHRSAGRPSVDRLGPGLRRPGTASTSRSPTRESRDITVVVPYDQLPAPDRTTDQASWLRAHGIDELVDAGPCPLGGPRAAPDLAAMRMRSRINEAEALLEPSGLGGFWVGEWLASGR